MADVVAFPIVSALAGGDIGRWPALARWFGLVGARPAVRRGMAILPGASGQEPFASGEPPSLQSVASDEQAGRGLGRPQPR